MDLLIISKLIFFFILITYLVDIIVIMKEEILSWSLTGVNPLTPRSGPHGNHSALCRGFLCLSRVLPTSRMFTSGYVNTETILHLFSVAARWENEQ